MADPETPQPPPGPDDVVTIKVGGKGPPEPPVIDYGAAKGKHPDSKAKPSG